MKYFKSLKIILFIVIFIIVNQQKLSAEFKTENKPSFFSTLYFQAPNIGFSPCYLGSRDACFAIGFSFARASRSKSKSKNGIHHKRSGVEAYNGRIAGHYALTNFTVQPLVAIGLDFGRKFDDGTIISRPINRLGKIKNAVVLGGGLKLNLKNFQLVSLGYFDVTTNRKGFDGVVKIITSFVGIPNIFNITPQLSMRFANKNFLNTEFGITSEQALTSAANYDPLADIYSTSGGIYLIGARINADYHLTDYTFLRFNISYEHLLARIANSPIVSKFGAKDQIGMFTSFNFKLWD